MTSSNLCGAKLCQHNFSYRVLRSSLLVPSTLCWSMENNMNLTIPISELFPYYLSMQLPPNISKLTNPSQFLNYQSTSKTLLGAPILNISNWKFNSTQHSET